MFLWPVAAETLCGNLEFLGTVTEAKEAKNPKKQPNSLRRDALHCADIDSLRVVTEPVAFT